MSVRVGRWHGGQCRWGWLSVTIDVVVVLGIAMVLIAIDTCKEEENEKKTYLLRRLRIDMQRLAMAAAAVVVNAGGWWPACSGYQRCGWSCIATGDVDERVCNRKELC